MDENEKWFIDRLDDRRISEADLVGCIDTLAVLLSLDALPALLAVMKDSSRPPQARAYAAKAINKIGPEYLKAELAELANSASFELRDLAGIAVHGPEKAVGVAH
jgi:hypothetical protein